MKRKKVSVIIVDYKSKLKVQRLVKSLPHNSQVEIIIIDNSKVNRGFAKACNLGAKQAQGEYLLFCNPDVIFLPSAFKLMFTKMESDSRIGIIGPQLLDTNR